MATETNAGICQSCGAYLPHTCDLDGCDNDAGCPASGDNYCKEHEAYNGEWATAEIAKLRAQRDDLLAACEAVCNEADEGRIFDSSKLSDKTIDLLEAAIAKAKP